MRRVGSILHNMSSTANHRKPIRNLFKSSRSAKKQHSLALNKADFEIWYVHMLVARSLLLLLLFDSYRKLIVNLSSIFISFVCILVRRRMRMKCSNLWLAVLIRTNIIIPINQIRQHLMIQSLTDQYNR